MVLLNDPQYVEAARVMAQNIMRHDQTLKENIELAFRKLTGRKPKENELELLIRVYDKSLNSFEKEPVLADKVLSVGEYMVDDELDKLQLAAHTLTFSTILNLDETISKE